MAQLDFIDMLQLDSEAGCSNQKRRRQIRQKEESNPLNTLLPYLYQESYRQDVLNSMKKDRNPRGFVSWDLKSELQVMQMSVCFIMIDDLHSCFYLNRETLVEHLEWIIDDPDDDFSFVACMQTIGLDKKQSYELIEQFLQNQLTSADKIRAEIEKKIDNVEYESPLDIPLTQQKRDLIKYVVNYDRNRKIINACIEQYFT